MQLAPVPHAPSRPPSPSPPRASARTAARALSVLIMDSEIETINSAWLDSVETGKSESKTINQHDQFQKTESSSEEEKKNFDDIAEMEE